MSDVLFTCTDRWGRVVTAHRATWRLHVLAEHYEMPGELVAVRSTIELPDFVCRDAGHAINRRENFYRRTPDNRGLLYKVCIAFDDRNAGELVTAYLTDAPGKEEEQRWPSF